MDTIVIEGSTNGSEVMAWVTLAVALAALLWTAYWNRRSERRGYLDEFWFRQVVAPKCIDPVLKFHEIWLQKIEEIVAVNINVGSVTLLLSDFQLEKSRVLNSTWVARVFSSGFYAECCDHLDSVEDSFAKELGDVLTSRKSLAQAQAAMKLSIGDASVAILSEAAKIHGGKLEPRKATRVNRA